MIAVFGVRVQPQPASPYATRTMKETPRYRRFANRPSLSALFEGVQAHYQS